MSDLTERLAAKLARWIEYDGDTPYVYIENAIEALPLLLSEPELVASLPDAVRLSVLNKRELAVMKLGEAALGLSKVRGFTDATIEHANAFNAALAEARALTPEGKDG